jgi:NitT/TauT family transport system ATP-binding protein
MVSGSLIQNGTHTFPDSGSRDEALIRLDDVHISYSLKDGTPKQVLNGIDLTIGRGEFVAVAGETGCGKSTLLRLILGAEMPSHGHVLVGGREIHRPDRDRGYVPQKYSLFPDKTVIENVTFGPEVEEFNAFTRLTPRFRRRRREFRTEALVQLRRMGLHDSDASKYPDQLSGGMQQRVAIAQALAMTPKILLMDEAFSALDPGTRAEMQALIRRVWAETGMTVLFVTHNINEAVTLGTRVIVLSKTATETGERTPDANGSKIVLDLPVPQSVNQPSKARHTEEFTRMVQRVESATCHLAQACRHR